MSRRQQTRREARRRKARAAATRRRALVGGGLSLGAVFGMGAVAEAATFEVTNDTDAGGTGDCADVVPAGDCSLRQAILNANEEAGADDITFQSGLTGATIALTAGELEIDTTVDLAWTHGTPSPVVDAGGASRVISIYDAGSVTISGLTLTGGLAEPYGGGGILSRYTDLTVADSVITGNTVGEAGEDDGGAKGGGIYSYYGSLSVEDSEISTNTAEENYGSGAGIAVTGDSAVTITDSELTGNQTTGSPGGGAGFEVFNVDGPVTIERSTIADNEASGTVGFDGAGFVLGADSLTIRDSTISGNSATEIGAGIYTAFTPTTVENSTFNDNTTGGYSGALGAYRSTLTVRGSTIDGNDGGDFGGGIYLYESAATLRNTIVAENTAAAGPDVFGPVNAAFTLFGSTSGAAVTTAVAGSNIIGDPQLGPLGNNGGPTMTMLPLSGSPVIDCGSGQPLSTDQRGEPRPVDQPNRTNSTAAGANGADIGAVELAENLAITGACANNAPPVTPVTPVVPVPPADTFNLKKAIKKCKKKFKGKAKRKKRKRCIRKAKRRARASGASTGSASAATRSHRRHWRALRP